MPLPIPVSITRLGSLELLRKRLPNDDKTRALLNNALQGTARCSTHKEDAFVRAAHGHQEIIEIVCDAAGQPANGFRLLALKQSFPCTFEGLLVLFPLGEAATKQCPQPALPGSSSNFAT